MLTASIGMYDFPWLEDANDALWAGIATRLRAAGVEGVPERLDRRRELGEIWRDETLLFGQTCGYPYVTELRGVVELVATPAYVWPGCEGEIGRSVMVVRADDAARTVADCQGRRFAMNGRDSNSGMNLPRALIAPLALGKPFFSQVLITGAHLTSLAAVIAGDADLAAIDCVTYGLAVHHRPDLVAGARVIAQTPPTPALPFVMSRTLAPTLRDTLRQALVDAIADPALGAATARLGLVGVAFLGDEDYDVLLDYQRVAEARGYPELV